MPVDFQFGKPEEGLVTVTATGNVTFADIAVMLDELLDDARVTPGTSVLVNAMTVTAVPSTAELRIIARDLKPLRDRGVERIALFTDSTFVYGVARMFGVFAEAVNLKVGAFRQQDDAQRWLESAHVVA